MAKVKLSPSIIEAFRKGRLYDNPVDDLKALFTGEYKPNEHTSRGTAFHSIIEHGEQPGYWDGGLFHIHEAEFGQTWAFTPEIVEAALQFRSRYRIAHEVSGSVTFQAAGHSIFSPLRVDGIWGNNIHEIKTKSGTSPDYETYLNSVQWRLYLEAFPTASTVIYSVFELKLSKKKPTLIDIKEIHQFVFHREPALMLQVQEEVRELIFFLELHGLLNLATIR